MVTLSPMTTAEFHSALADLTKAYSLIRNTSLTVPTDKATRVWYFPLPRSLHSFPSSALSRHPPQQIHRQNDKGGYKSDFVRRFVILHTNLLPCATREECRASP